MFVYHTVYLEHKKVDKKMGSYTHCLQQCLNT